MFRKIVADSSANLLGTDGADFASVPLRILAGDMEYVDDAELDVSGMQEDLRKYKGRSGTACPGAGDWLAAFGEAEEVFGVSITSHLSGCYNSARIAAEEYTAKHPDRKVFVLDSLSTGPEMQLIVEEYARLIGAGHSFEQICEEIVAYTGRTHLLFSLESLMNFAKNGRISQALAAVAGLLGIRMVGRASTEGELELLHKCRGEKKAIQQLWKCMRDAGYAGGRVRIHHSGNPEGAESLAAEIRAGYPDCDIRTRENRGLCSYYAEKGGILVGFEGE